jgi:hypothetical protein
VVPAIAGPFAALSFADAAPTEPPPPRASVLAKRPRLAKRKLSLRLGCSAGPSRCAGRLVARTAGKVDTGRRKRRIVVARGRYEIGPGEKRVVRVSLTALARRLRSELPGRKLRVSLQPAVGERVVRVLRLGKA